MLPEPKEHGFLHIVIEPSERAIQHNVLHYVTADSSPQLPLPFQLQQPKKNTSVLPLPGILQLRIDNLSNTDDCEWISDNSCDATREAGNQCLLSVTQIVCRLMWFETVVYVVVNGVADKQIGHS